MLPESEAPQKKSLLDAVMDEVKEALTRKKAKVFSYSETVSLIKDSIRSKYKGDEKEQALSAITKGFEGYPSAQEDLAHAFSFVMEFHGSKLDLWMNQFVTESVKAYEGDNGLSCTKGVQERSTLGLRGMDVHLDKFFAQAEGPATIKVLLANCNFGDKDFPDRARFVAGKLIEQGWTPSTTAEEAGKMFFLFLAGEAKANHLTESQTEKYRSQFDVYAELIEGDLSSETSILKRALVEEA
ncbi:hypothetical protein OAN21_02920 [Alphaproteobacteria bacterium]|nr:hypothetical protein [Alphaproteobacteria bacterium]